MQFKFLKIRWNLNWKSRLVTVKSESKSGALLEWNLNPKLEACLGLSLRESFLLPIGNLSFFNEPIFSSTLQIPSPINFSADTSNNLFCSKISILRYLVRHSPTFNCYTFYNLSTYIWRIFALIKMQKICLCIPIYYHYSQEPKGCHCRIRVWIQDHEEPSVSIFENIDLN